VSYKESNFTRRRFEEKTMVNCPACDGAMDVDEEEVDEGDTLSCDECGASLKVLSKDPLELEPADDASEDEDEEDLDDDEEDDEEEDDEEEEDEWK
jgi:alpha-aminoadipate carrier protein LysW